MPKGDHFFGCVNNYPDCPCIKCQRDGEADSRGDLCCDKRKRGCNDAPCKDFTADTEEEEDDV